MGPRDRALGATEEGESGAPPVEAGLWLRVVEQALSDSISTNRWRDPGLRTGARAWLVEYSHDLAEVLGHVGIDVNWWLAKAAPRLRRHWAEVDTAPASQNAHVG